MAYKTKNGEPLMKVRSNVNGHIHKVPENVAIALISSGFKPIYEPKELRKYRDEVVIINGKKKHIRGRW